jgi:hypothetical protein
MRALEVTTLRRIATASSSMVRKAVSSPGESSIRYMHTSSCAEVLPEVLRTNYVCEFRARERCTFVHVGVTAEDRCNACEWLKQCANLTAKSTREQTLAMPVAGSVECSFLQLAWTAERLNL